ncbi:N-acetylmuramoyl-L-alanine amidase [Lysinibacillus sp. 54212]|uniref:N-acetylmuramoyl-L-alanine amidase n=1 Tax=Lysinibacillus sp. 54212 TaxID=3119829 RepID=UPI002FC90E7C
MKKTLQLFIIGILLVSLILPSAHTIHVAHAETNDLIVSGEILNLREGPGLSYPIIVTLKEGDSLSSIEKSGDWIHVKADNHEGWVASWLTKSSSGEDNNKEQKIIISQVDRLNVRSEPSLSSTVLTQLSSGQEAAYIKQQKDWIQIQSGNITGWVSEAYVTVNAISTSVPKKEQETKVTDSNTFTITVDAVNIRSKPDLTSKQLKVAKRGEQYTVLARENNWVQIKMKDGKKGWIYSFYGTFTGNKTVPATKKEAQDESVTIIYNGTNLREEASTASAVVLRADAGETFPIIAKEDDWFKISLGKNKFAYVANWVVSTTGQPVATEQKKSEPRKKGTLRGTTIVIDPGHGGNDHGTTGVRGTEEKDITLLTAELLKSKLRAAGANVILTRESDTYVDLRKRVGVGHQNEADAFISIHYDATEDSSVSGITTYYTNSYQKNLADYVHAGLSKKVKVRDRGVQPGNYLVLRENRQNAILIELGFLSNPNEERTIVTDYYREQATLGIYEGLLKYFDAH